MDDSVHVEVARADDRDRLVEVLQERGVDARPLEDSDGLGLEVPCGDDSDRTCDELIAELETWIAESGLLLVPEKAGGSVFLRPPAS